MLVNSLSIESLLLVLPLPPCLPRGRGGVRQGTVVLRVWARGGFPGLLSRFSPRLRESSSASSKGAAHLRAAARRSIFTKWFQMKGYKTLLQRDSHWQNDRSLRKCHFHDSCHYHSISQNNSRPAKCWFQTQLCDQNSSDHLTGILKNVLKFQFLGEATPPGWSVLCVALPGWSHPLPATGTPPPASPG